MIIYKLHIYIIYVCLYINYIYNLRMFIYKLNYVYIYAYTVYIIYIYTYLNTHNI